MEMSSLKHESAEKRWEGDVQMFNDDISFYSLFLGYFLVGLVLIFVFYFFSSYCRVLVRGKPMTALTCTTPTTSGSPYSSWFR
jgi:hypothetical protein